MTASEIQTSVKSYQKRLEGRKEDAIVAIRDGSMWSAQIALGECIAYQAVIDELQFQLDDMEVTRID